jgi:uncharacterized protein
MIFGAMSDTHGNRALMFAVADRMIHDHHAETIFHLGDDYADVEELRNAGYPVQGVPGLWCREYHLPQVPNVIVEEFDGIRVAATHAEQDIRGKMARAAVLLTGHTHEAAIRMVRGRIRVNPGHLKGEISRGQAASYAILTIEKPVITVAIHDWNGALRRKETFNTADLAL